MKLHPEDPRLSDYLLGELPADEAAAVEREVAKDEALRLALRELAMLQRVLTETLAPGSQTLSAGQRETIRAAARHSVDAGESIPIGTRQRYWSRRFVPLAAAAAITLAAFLWIPQSGFRQHATVSHAPVAPTLHPATQEHDSRPPPAPGPADTGAANPPAAPPTALATSAGFPSLRTRASVLAADCPTLDLPVRAGDSSLGWIRQSVLSDHRLPRRDAVRLEEILNRFSLRPIGPFVVARLPANHWHPDDRGTGASIHAATIAAETLACPWQPSASLVLISIRGNSFSDCDIQAVFHANPQTVRRYRLLGFAPVAGQPITPLPTGLPAQTSTSIVLEIEPTATPGDLGIIEWSVDGQVSTALTLTPHGDQKPSADARFAALVCTFAQWLAGESAATIHADLLAALARETTSPTLPAERADFLNLIDQALKL